MIAPFVRAFLIHARRQARSTGRTKIPRLGESPWTRRAALSRIGVIAALIASMACGRPADAGTSYKINQGISEGHSYTFTIDFEGYTGDTKTVDVTVGVAAGGADLSAADVAGKIAAAINAKFPTASPLYASTTSSNLKINGDEKSLETANLPKNFITQAAADTKPFGGDIRFAPDLVTGNDVLTSAGSYTLSGPGGLSTSFDAPIGTTGDQLAIMLSGVLTSQGYAATALGNDVVFTTPGAGEFDFTPNGAGIDYTINAVPEIPSIGYALISCTIGLVYAFLLRR
jgi:hypothetical protein